MNTEGIEVRSVGNTITLHETALIEAFNLKAAIEYQLKNCKCSVIFSDIDSKIFFLSFYKGQKETPIICLIGINRQFCVLI